MNTPEQMSLELSGGTGEVYLENGYYNSNESEPETFTEEEQTARATTLLNDLDANSCTLIFRAVILQLLIDLRSESTKEDRVRFKQEAIAWYASDDYPMVCDLADVDQELLSEEIEAIIQGRKGKEGTSDFRVLRKKKLKNRMEYGDAY